MNYQAVQKATVLGHKRVKHGGVPKLKCDQCTFQSFHRGGMSIHMQKHGWMEVQM